jgi:hypothetical protein
MHIKRWINASFISIQGCSYARENTVRNKPQEKFAKGDDEWASTPAHFSCSIMEQHTAVNLNSA